MGILNPFHDRWADSNTFYSKYEALYYRPRFFVDQYLYRVGRHEDPIQLAERRKFTYPPGISRRELNKVHAFLCKSITNTQRDGTPSYNLAATGAEGGINARGSSISAFMADVARDLLVYGRMGIYVDLPPKRGETRAHDTTPYVYSYSPGDICNWQFDRGRLSYLVLRNNLTYLEFILRNDRVLVSQFETIHGDPVRQWPLEMSEIPFIDISLPNSVLAEAVDIEIALMNLYSSADSYVRFQSIPFYTEQVSTAMASNFQKKDKSAETNRDDMDEGQNVKVGTYIGRTYPVGSDRPGFIGLSEGPIKSAEARAKEMKDDIVNAVRQNFGQLVNGDMTEGLNFITIQLQDAENEIIRLWSRYEGLSTKGRAVYPRDYVFLDDKYEEIDRLKAVASLTSSESYKRAILRRIANITLTGSATQAELTKIHDEIDSLPAIVTQPDMLHRDVEVGLVSAEMASKLRGFPEGEAAKANVERAERIRIIALAQGDSTARGVADGGVNPDASSNEKDFRRNDPTRTDTTDPVRGRGKMNPKG